MNPVGVILGRGEGVWTELDAALALIEPASRAVLIAINKAGRDYPGRVPHWVSYHPDLIPHWITERKRKRLPEHAAMIWSAMYGPGSTKAGSGRVKFPVQYIKTTGGSSGLLAVDVAIKGLGFKHAILCGVPLEKSARYDNPTPWREGEVYRQAWLDRSEELKQYVRSMSGWTQGLLGAPTREWLDAAVP